MYNFSHLAFLINEDIPKQLHKTNVLSNHFINRIITPGAWKRANLDMQLLSTVKSAPNEEAIRIAIRSTQYDIVALTDKLIQWLPDGESEWMHNYSPGDETGNTFKYLHKVLYDLFVYMEANFPRYMDREYRLPAYSKHLHSIQVIDALVTVKISPLFRSLDSRLQQIVLAPLEEAILPAPDAPLTYNRRHYTARLARELVRFVRDENGDEKQLHDRLQCIDFNCKEYIGYLTTQFAATYANSNIREQYIWLITQRKRTAHLLVEDGISFMADQQPLKIHLDNWFKWEIYYIRQLMQLETAGN
ncbi:hypothetical protein [Chitinophaga agri]|uniref:Uncharacterized protein n=1 Tax=Chitinophaga agri TaxID=2703787 RepID=A0A6B9ZL83_9BACT|nr:hypothetical protein [Chitinophaga agri]QHS63152.1 hypothetical protein GWR21_27260 [Chitinophaga agri]